MIDTHCHLHDKKFDEDRGAVVERARRAGITAMIAVGEDLDDSRRAIAMAKEYGLRAAAGIHPHEARNAPADIAGELGPLLADERVVAIGETGLDYYYDFSPREVQAAVLRARLPRLAAWTARRRAIAARYRTRLSNTHVEVVPECDPGHVYHLFVVRTRSRAELQASLAAAGIETLIHYPIPIPRQPAVASTRPADCPLAAQACGEVLSLPLHPALSDTDVDAVADAVRKGQNACVH